MFILQVNSVQCVDFGVARWYIMTPITVTKKIRSGETSYFPFCFFFCFFFVETKLNVLFMLAFDRE